MTQMNFHDFDTSEQLAQTLAKTVAEKLQEGIEARNIALLAVSGGTTPKLFFETLSRIQLDWHKVTVTLVDERCVPLENPRSNAKFVRDTLLQNKAMAAHFIPLWTEAETINERLAELPLPFDAIMLGMGTDGHTASFFSHSAQLVEALTARGPAVALFATEAKEPRITLTLPFLLKTKNLFLHIEGLEKQKTLEKALENGAVEDMPVRAVLRQTTIPIDIYGTKL